MYGRPYFPPQRQLVGAAGYPQLVGAGPGYPQLVGRAGYPNLVGAYPMQLGNFAPPGSQGFATDPNGAVVYPLIGNNPGSTGTVLMDGIPSQTRQWPFPMPRVNLGPTAAADSTNTAQLIVRPTRLTITESTGPSDITDISVGQRSQFINRGGTVPITMFGPTATDSLVNFDTAAVGNTITVGYVNNGVAATVISTGLLCVTAAY
jgi:hypothetical protein